MKVSEAKYKYVSSQDIVDTDEKYIKELERITEDYVDFYNFTTWEWHSVLIPKITSLTIENNKLKLELKLINKFLEEAKRKTNRDFNE
tara:strand:- start:622 stop:885 length:264 start_codon:yes stop_codon:yes gene_type:complete